MTPSRVEQTFLAWSGDPLRYDPVEHVGVLVVDHFPLLGKLTALRFLEWVQAHPEGVISLPTGKTPEYFIRWVQHYLHTWNEPDTRRDLARHGVDPDRKPDMRGLRFVQMDEFYPVDPVQTNSFYHYIQRFYLKGFGLDPERALLMDARAMGLPEGMALQEVWPDGRVDLTLRYRAPRTALERLQKRVIEAVDAWCQRYEEQIRAWGGLGFFLGGIGPDGHIAFNVRGSDHHSTTRLTETNYETQAAAAVDLGGIETARGHKVITIGLGTITYNPGTVAIIFAAGEAKARVVRDAIEQEPHVRYPGTALQKLPHARFYLTRGAASLLTARRLAALKKAPPDQETTARILIDVALANHKPLRALTEQDLQNDLLGKALLPHLGSSLPRRLTLLEQALRDRLERGRVTRGNTVFLHTAPHHDDILLGYLPLAVRHIRDATNHHHFAYLTSGFTAVTNAYARDLLLKLRVFLERSAFDHLWAEGYFAPDHRLGRNRDVWQYLDGVAARDLWMMAEGEARRMLRNLVDLYDLDSLEAVAHRIRHLVDYFEQTYPGALDPPDIQRLKGMIREWEADCLWGYFGFNTDHIHHLRLAFYTGDIFTEPPTLERDVPPVLDLLRRVHPDVVTVAFDPEGAGPDTHYKVLQTLAEALRLYLEETGREDVRVLGYRNVWYRFHPAEANLYVPVSLNMFAVLESAFLHAFSSQKEASFPSYEHDGPFHELAQRIQVEQYRMLKTLLGRDHFYRHESPLIRATRGLVFVREMTPEAFFQSARSLRETMEVLPQIHEGRQENSPSS